MKKSLRKKLLFTSYVERGTVFRIIGKYNCAMNDYFTSREIIPGKKQKLQVEILYSSVRFRMGDLKGALSEYKRIEEDIRGKSYYSIRCDLYKNISEVLK